MLIGMVSTQVGAAFAKHLFGVAGPAAMTAMRLGFAALVLLLWWRPAVRISRPTLALVVAYGTSFGGMNLCFYLAMARMPLGVALTIGFSGPLAVAILSSRRRLDLLWVLLAALGVVLLGWTGGTGGLGGLLLALTIAVFWGAYVPLAAAVGRRIPGGGGLALAMAWGSLCVIPFGIAESGSALTDPHVLAPGLAVALLSSLVPYLLEMETLRRVTPLVFGVLLSLEPGIGAAIAWIGLGEHLRAAQVLGIAAVVVASVGAIYGTQRMARRGPVPDGKDCVPDGKDCDVRDIAVERTVDGRKVAQARSEEPARCDSTGRRD
jgi:inner membrane transporter RhtA